jgi:hypothetical protein
MKIIKNDTKKVFWKKGTCSQTFCYLLNREFGHTKENEERASDPSAGGLMGTGHQCGMLWGASLAAGAESFRKCGNNGLAIAAAITTTQHLMASFSKRAKTVNCREITGCDLTSRFGMAKLMIKTVFCGFIYSPCFNLAEKWAPEAIQSAKEGLSQQQTDLSVMPLSCASEIAKKMGASDEEIVMVAGFAGGLGLSGNACGALSATIWMNTLAWCKNHPGKTPPYFNNPYTIKILKDFYGATTSETLCHKISGRCFKTIDDHTEYIKNGGCDKLIALLARS